MLRGFYTRKRLFLGMHRVPVHIIPATSFITQVIYACYDVASMSHAGPWRRASAAVRSLGAATVNGAVTTFLGVMPIAFSYYKYFVVYFFTQYVIILAVCLFQVGWLSRSSTRLTMNFLFLLRASV